jgi:hypothetical protein
MRRIAAIAVAGVILLLLVVAQLVLPGIAAQRLHDRLARSGRVLQVKVSAFPAIELLWHHADHVVISMASYSSNSSDLGNLIGQADDVGSLDASTRQLESGLLRLRDATLRKRGDALTGSATVAVADVKHAFPILQSIQPIASGNGQLILRGTATLLGVSATVDATVAAVSGQLVVAPNVPFGGLATVTLFSNPHVYVEGVAARPAAGGFAVAGRARLR